MSDLLQFQAIYVKSLVEFSFFEKPRFRKLMKAAQSNSKTPSCNNFSHLPEREATLQRIQILQDFFNRSEEEFWQPLRENPNYIISSWGRVKHLNSYGGKTRYLTPTIRLNKYPYITITCNNKRKGIRLHPFKELLPISKQESNLKL